MLVYLKQWLPRARTRSRFFRYTSAFVLVSLALLVTLALPALHYHTPFVLIFPTVILIGVVLGLGPGLLAAVVAATGLLLWVTPAGSNARPAYWEPIQIVSYMVVASAMLLLIDWLRRAESRLEAERASWHLAHSEAEQTATRLYEAERSARQAASAAAHKAELTADRMARLQTVTAELAAVLTRAQVVDIILRNRDAALNAAALAVKLVSDDGQWLESTDVSDYPEEVQASYQRYPVSAAVPMADAVRSRKPIWLESAAVYLERYPQLSKDIVALGLEAAAAIPLMLGERILGGIGISFPTTMSFNLEEREYLLTLASQYAQALDRIRLYEAEQQARVQLEARVLERTAELERSNHDLNQFAYVASHDLKAPIRAIDNLAEWITQDAGSLLPPQSAEHLAKLRGRAKRMEKLLDDLLDYSRAGRVRHPSTLVDTRLLVQETLDFLSLPPGFVAELVGPMPTLCTEQVPLETVFRNLIQNSYKHHDHPNDGHVCISAQELDDTVVFMVADDGPGIAPQYHGRIFEIFQTLKPRDEMEGSGIGLTVVKKVVESRGGSLRLESAEGTGATFFITWPKQV